MIEEEILRPLITIFVISIITFIGSYLIHFYISNSKKVEFYRDVEKVIETMKYMKESFGEYSYREVKVEIPKGCHLIIDNKTDTISYGCGKDAKIAMRKFRIDILLVSSGDECKIVNNTFESGSYRLILALVPELPKQIKPCVVYFE